MRVTGCLINWMITSDTWNFQLGSKVCLPRQLSPRRRAVACWETVSCARVRLHRLSLQSSYPGWHPCWWYRHYLDATNRNCCRLLSASLAPSLQLLTSLMTPTGENSSFVRLSVCFVVLVNDKSTTFLCICSQNVSEMITAPGSDTHQLCVVIQVKHQAALPLQVVSHLFRKLFPEEIPPSLGHRLVSSQVDKTAARAF